MENTDVIFKAWHEQAEALLPEFNFYRKANGDLISRSGLKITGEAGNAGKVYYYAHAPFYLKDYTRGNKGLITHIKEREGITGTAEALQYMAAAAGVPFTRFRSEEEQKAFEERQRKAELLEAANNFFIDSLTYKESTHAQTPEAAAVRRMLEERGYKQADLRPPVSEHDSEAPYMEVGFFPSYEALLQHLEGTGYDSGSISETVARILPAGADTTNRLTIPYRNAGGQIVGFAFRQTAASARAKYLYSTGLKKDALLFNFRWNKYTDLIIVEGLLDAMIAKARGVSNVVAIGGNQITAAQARAAVKNCGGQITLCLDNDTAGRQGTDKAIGMLLDAADTEGLPLKIWIARLPEGIKDADELITRQGIDAFKKAVGEDAVRDTHYWNLSIKEKYIALQDADGQLSERHTEALLEEVIQTAAKTRTPTDREKFIGYFTDAFAGIVTPEAIEEEAARLRRDAQQNRQQREIVSTVNTVNSLIKGGADPAAVIAKLKEDVSRIEVIRGADLIPKASNSEMLAAALKLTPSMKTGYGSLDKFFNYEAGAVTLIAGRTSHGKTVFMFNSMLQMAQLSEYADRTFYFFSYEEAVQKLYWKLLISLIDEEIPTLLLPQTPDIAGSYAGRFLSNEKMLSQYVRDVQARRFAPVERIEAARQKLADLIDGGRIVISDKRLTVEQLETAIKSAAKRSNFGAAFIDYVQRVKTEKEAKDRRGEIDHVSAVLNRTATETDVPLIVGSQFNRQAVDNKGGKTTTEPRLEHLKESGALEEDANAVLSLYNETADKIEAGEKEAFNSKEALLVVRTLKTRDGERNKMTQLLFRQHLRKIKDMTHTDRLRLVKDKEENRKKQKEEETF